MRRPALLVVVLLAIVLVATVGRSLADEPPSWQNFQLTSQNGWYVAKVTAFEGMDDRDPWNKHYTLSVYQTDNESEPMWSSRYLYDGYLGGMLSNNGSVFVYVNFWYHHDDPVIYVYNRGALYRKITGKDLGMVEATLSRSVSHTLWLSDEDSIFIYGPSGRVKAIEIPTVQGIRTVVVE